MIDAKSGYTGAGRRPALNKLLTEAENNFCAYALGGGHRHTPEIEMAVDMFAGSSMDLTFVPHLVPIVRGILSDCYLTLKKDAFQEDVDAVYGRQYGKERFVHYTKDPLSREVTGSNHAEVSARVLGKHVAAFGAIDNLVKGASGQAVQCMNLMLNLDEAAGLDFPGLGV